VATSVLFHEELQLTANRSLYMLITTFLTAYLMVSTVRFRSFKDFDIRSHHAFSKLVIAVVIAIAIASNPDINLFLAVVTFIGLNLIVHVFRSLFRRRRDDPNAAPRGTESPKGTA
jgi:CDP-diacylglycerol--serine O-phosphatidyltransferase